jgi:hypothetical protein
MNQKVIQRTPEQERADFEADLNQIILGIESRGDDGVVAVKEGEAQHYPQDMRKLELLENRGLIASETIRIVSARGQYTNITYKITPLGRMKAAEIKLSQS